MTPRTISCTTVLVLEVRLLGVEAGDHDRRRVDREAGALEQRLRVAELDGGGVLRVEREGAGHGDARGVLGRGQLPLAAEDVGLGQAPMCRGRRPSASW